MGVYRLAICEDDPGEREFLCSLCGELLSARHIPHVLTPFSSAEDLAETLERDSGAFDLLLLDIQMDGMSGMELAQALYRRRAPVRFLFITGCADYALEGYQVHPVHYLLKPVDRSSLEEALLQDWESHHQPEAFLLRIGPRSFSLPIKEIRYLESRNHVVTVCMEGEEHTAPLSLSKVESMLPARLFFRCHNSFLVNLSHVGEIERTTLRLRDGTRLPIRRRYYQAFQSAFIHYLNQTTERQN